tara:strand:+ start:271 stop:768 length:498 start_codon:yes stop_codon:yes gene_type:complete
MENVICDNINLIQRKKKNILIRICDNLFNRCYIDEIEYDFDVINSSLTKIIVLLSFDMVNLSKIDLKFNTNGIGIGLELGDNKTISQECILMGDENSNNLFYRSHKFYSPKKICYLSIMKIQKNITSSALEGVFVLKNHYLNLKKFKGYHALFHESKSVPFNSRE